MSNLATLYRDDVSVGTYKFQRGTWRRWSGRRWAKASLALHPERLKDARPLDGYPEIAQDERTRLLELLVDSEVLHDARVVNRSERGITLGYPQRIHHLGHALATLATGGLWAVVWIAKVVSRREVRVRYEVDAWGSIWPVAAA